MQPIWNPCISNRFQAVSSTSWLCKPLGRKAIQFLFSKGKSENMSFSVMHVHFWTVDEWRPRWKHCSSLDLTEQSLNEVPHIQYTRVQSLFLCWFCFSRDQEQWRQPCKERLFPKSARIQGYLGALAQHWPRLAPAEWLKHSYTQPAWAPHSADTGMLPSEPSRVGSVVERHSSASKKSQPGCSMGSNIEVCRTDVHSILTYWNIFAPCSQKYSVVHTLSVSNSFTG